MQHIYFLKQLGTNNSKYDGKSIYSNAYKIGYTTNNIFSRIKTIQTGNPNKLELIHSFSFIGKKHVIKNKEEIKKIEQELHKILREQYQDDHIRGEWYDLDNNDILDIIEYFKNTYSNYIEEYNYKTLKLNQIEDVFKIRDKICSENEYINDSKIDNSRSRYVIENIKKFKNYKVLSLFNFDERMINYRCPVKVTFDQKEIVGKNWQDLGNNIFKYFYKLDENKFNKYIDYLKNFSEYNQIYIGNIDGKKDEFYHQGNEFYILGEEKEDSPNFNFSFCNFVKYKILREKTSIFNHFGVYSNVKIYYHEADLVKLEKILTNLVERR